LRAHSDCEVFTVDRLVKLGFVPLTLREGRIVCSQIFLYAVFLLSILLLVLSSPVSAQTQSGLVVTSPDSLLKRLVNQDLDRLFTSRNISRDSIRVIAPREFFDLIRTQAISNSGASVFSISDLHAWLSSVAGSGEGNAAYTRMLHFDLTGQLSRNANTPSELIVIHDSTFAGSSSTGELSSEDLGSHSFIELRPFQKQSFWASVLQPIAVLVGAAAIIALFFIIRS
jgi:hypothetical protein